MKSIAMCFSLFQLPRCKVHSILGNSWWENIYKLSRNNGGSSKYSVLCSNNYELDGGHNKRWTRVTRRTINTKAEKTNETLISKTSIKHELFPETAQSELETTKIEKSRKVATRNSIKSSKYELDGMEIKSDQYYVDLAKLATVICFDIETTGLGREKNRIIEIACQDLRGGGNSTFQTLVNPERYVWNEQIHGISTHMVNRADVPRMKDLIPILIQYVQSRQLPGGVVVLVAHNGRAFDVPFLKSEFNRCSFEIPPDWFFVDTLPLARKLMKSKVSGTKATSKSSLQALREHYGIPLIGSAHRALSDVHSLALILQRLTFDLKLPVSGLIKDSFK